ncbi:hypothetical protein A2U01_0100915, partial [Trifolium medium]|nr:hypothetical protein [Trifolium medium]
MARGAMQTARGAGFDDRWEVAYVGCAWRRGLWRAAPGCEELA